MPSPSVTYTFSNSTTADATQVNQNFTDLINAMSDGTKDFSISALTVGGNAAFNGNVTLGNASGDDITVTGSLASSIPIKTTNTYNIGTSTLGLLSIYFGSSGGAFSTRLIGAAAASSWTLTLPTGVPSAAGYILKSDASGTTAWESRTVLQVVSKTFSDTPYTATLANDVVVYNASGGASGVNLPAAASSSGKTLMIKKTDSSTNVVTIDANGSETIDGALTYVLRSQYETVTLTCDGSNWHVVNKDAYNVATARLTYSAGTPTISTERYGDWISSLTDVGTGQITVNMTSGYFSAAPMVAGASEENAVSGSSLMIISESTSTIGIRIRDLAGTLADENCKIVAVGLR